ncbi:MAG TPA: DUF3194 domain-containing protein [Candidatus Bathyarchaeia archaeon]|nr:DUF3194 domain-containing protein [Candidatus Bathyarchaeia archaeon]
MKLVVELGIPELTSEQIEELCAAAENAARKHVLSKVSAKLVEKLNISVEAEGTKPVKVTVEIDLALSPQAEALDQKTLVEEAVQEAFKASENYMRKLT